MLYELKYDDQGHIVSLGFFSDKTLAEKTIAHIRMVQPERTNFGAMRFVQIGDTRLIDQEGGEWIIDEVDILTEALNVKGMTSKAWYAAERNNEKPYADEELGDKLKNAIPNLAKVLDVDPNEIVAFDPEEKGDNN